MDIFQEYVEGACLTASALVFTLIQAWHAEDWADGKARH